MTYTNDECRNAIATMKAEMLDVLTRNILPFWMSKMVDEEHGGFYGRMDGRMKLHPEADKGAILNARILWSFSAAYRVLSEECREDSSLLALGSSLQRAKDYFIEHFIDHEYGGVFWSVDYLGRPKDTKSCTPSSSCFSACSGDLMRFAAMTGIFTSFLTAAAKYFLQPHSKLVGSSQ